MAPKSIGTKANVFILSKCLHEVCKLEQYIIRPFQNLSNHVQPRLNNNELKSHDPCLGKYLKPSEIEYIYIYIYYIEISAWFPIIAHVLYIIYYMLYIIYYILYALFCWLVLFCVKLDPWASDSCIHLVTSQASNFLYTSALGHEHTFERYL